MGRFILGLLLCASSHAHTHAKCTEILYRGPRRFQATYVVRSDGQAVGTLTAAVLATTGTYDGVLSIGELLLPVRGRVDLDTGELSVDFSSRD